MPRVTKSLKAKSRHKKVLKSTKGHYGARRKLLKLLSSQILRLCSILLEIEKIEKEILDLFGFPESMLQPESTGYHILF